MFSMLQVAQVVLIGIGFTLEGDDGSNFRVHADRHHLYEYNQKYY